MSGPSGFSRAGVNRNVCPTCGQSIHKSEKGRCRNCQHNEDIRREQFEPLEGYGYRARRFEEGQQDR